MMPRLSAEEIARLKRLEAAVRQERKRLGVLIRAQCRLRVDAWDNGRKYSELESRRRDH
jgi:type II secretory pathway predicted ATPase ExeA